MVRWDCTFLSETSRHLSTIVGIQEDRLGFCLLQNHEKVGTSQTVVLLHAPDSRLFTEDIKVLVGKFTLQEMGERFGFTRKAAGHCQFDESSAEPPVFAFLNSLIYFAE